MLSAEDLIINPKEHPDLNIGDVVEIYHPDDEGTRLLLQISSFNEELVKGREVISVESSIALAFNLRTYGDVIMQVVNPSAVALDSVEITFKGILTYFPYFDYTNEKLLVLRLFCLIFNFFLIIDLYMGRSEMWRLKSYLTGTCVYINKKIENISIRCQVNV